MITGFLNFEKQFAINFNYFCYKMYKEIFNLVLNELILIVEKIREKKIEPEEDEYTILFVNDLQSDDDNEIIL